MDGYFSCFTNKEGCKLLRSIKSMDLSRENAVNCNSFYLVVDLAACLLLPILVKLEEACVYCFIAHTGFKCSLIRNKHQYIHSFSKLDTQSLHFS